MVVSVVLSPGVRPMAEKIGMFGGWEDGCMLEDDVQEQAADEALEGTVADRASEGRHGLADGHGWEIIGALVRPTAHGRIHSPVSVADEELAIGQLWHLLFSNRKVVWLWDAPWSRRKNDAPIYG